MSTYASMQISRDGFSDLELVTPGVYDVLDGTGPGMDVIESTVIESRWMSGGLKVGQRKGMSSATLVVRVYGSTRGQIETRARAVVLALSQWSYTVTWTHNTSAGESSGTWSCLAFTQGGLVGGIWNSDAFAAGFQDITFALPRQPL